MTKAKVTVLLGIGLAAIGGLLLIMGGEQVDCIALFTIGGGVGIILCSLMVPGGGTVPGPQTHYIRLTIDPRDPNKIVVDPPDLKGTTHKDIVVFVNDTNNEVTVDFSVGGGSTPFWGTDSFNIPAGTTSTPYEDASSIMVIHDQETEYPYSVATQDGSSTDQLQQSPRIRVGPKD